MAEASLEKLIQERQFAGILQTHSEVFFRLANTLFAQTGRPWNKKHYFQLINEADALESFLDDYGARFNRSYAFLTELVASLRGFALAGYSLSHLEGRFDSYGAAEWMSPSEFKASVADLDAAREHIRKMSVAMLDACRTEAQLLDVEITPESFPESNFLPVVARRRLPRNVGETELVDEEQKIAEVASKFVQAADMLANLRVRRIEDPTERQQYLTRVCTEELARVYEATVHNLQSTYDTHVQNTVLESRDPRLTRIRGHVSSALHMLEAVTCLTHFVERHEDDIRSEEAKHKISRLVDRGEVQDVILNRLLFWAERYLESGSHVANDLLPSYMNVQELVVELPEDLSLHARPVALIVGIVNNFGTPVEMDVADQTCNAGSILELLVAIGSHPDARTFKFRGDENPLRHIRLLFEHDLGERGLEGMPEELAYLSGA
jgi:phosphotransferase system HPr-like phosphotransfer protein